MLVSALNGLFIVGRTAAPPVTPQRVTRRGVPDVADPANARLSSQRSVHRREARAPTVTPHLVTPRCVPDVADPANARLSSQRSVHRRDDRRSPRHPPTG